MKYRWKWPQCSFWGQVTARSSQGAARIPPLLSNVPTERFCICQVTDNSLEMLLCPQWFSDRNSLSRAFPSFGFDAGCVHKDREQSQDPDNDPGSQHGTSPEGIVQNPQSWGRALCFCMRMNVRALPLHFVPATPFQKNLLLFAKLCVSLHAWSKEQLRNCYCVQAFQLHFHGIPF